MIRSLGDQLLPDLQNATEFYAAVALMNDYGLAVIENALPRNCLRVYLVGTHLPTPPTVLRTLLNLQSINSAHVFSRVWKENANYHPKVYIVRNSIGELAVFIGSANATRGGFQRNIEISVKIVDPAQTEELLLWFTEVFMLGKTFNSQYIDLYEKTYKRNKQLQATQKSNSDNFIARAVAVPGNVIVPPGQFFRQTDFDAFSPSTHFDTTAVAVGLRAAVRKRLIELNDLIVPRFAAEGIVNLNNHPSRVSITSQHFHSRGHNHIPKDAIWLHYGKSHRELSNYKHYDFTQHLRMQVILRHTAAEAYVGIWLFVAKRNGSFYDREYLQTHLNSPGFLQDLFNYLTNLGNAYWIEINGNELYVEDMLNLNTLESFIRSDKYSGEFIIGRIYQPDDPDLSEENIADAVLVEFSKLYKIYDLIKDR